MKINLTAVDVDIEITGSSTVTQGSDILVVGVTVVNRVNDLSEASISLGYKTKAGLQKLRNLFPQGGEGAHFGEAKITLRKGGPLSNITKDYVLFKGTIVGFAHTKAAGGIQFQLRARGGLYQLSQMIVGSPGFHPSTPQSWGIRALSADAGGGGGGARLRVERIVRSCSSRKNAFEMYKCVVDALLDQWKNVRGGKLGIAFEAARVAYGLGAGNVSIVKKLLDTIKVAPGISSDFFTSLKGSSAVDITMSAISSSQLTFWSYLIGVLSTYGLDLISVGDATLVVSKSPLIKPVKTNMIKAEDEAQIQLDDAPFLAPTRAIITGYKLSSHLPDPSLDNRKELAIFPESPKPTTQEAKTGVKTIVVPVPGFFAWGKFQAALDINNAAKTQKNNAAVHGVKKAQKNAKALAQKTKPEVNKMREAYQLFAKYVLMKAKFKQRTGVVVTALKPEILPGFCANIEDPLNVATFDGYVQAVTHRIDYQSATAQTTLQLNYLRYGGELDPNPFANPFYPSYSAEAASKQVLSVLSGS